MALKLSPGGRTASGQRMPQSKKTINTFNVPLRILVDRFNQFETI
jgi:hypothetical protein